MANHGIKFDGRQSNLFNNPNSPFTASEKQIILRSPMLSARCIEDLTLTYYIGQQLEENTIPFTIIHDLALTALDRKDKRLTHRMRKSPRTKFRIEDCLFMDLDQSSSRSRHPSLKMRQSKEPYDSKYSKRSSFYNVQLPTPSVMSNRMAIIEHPNNKYT
jgi:hypothetical protein